MELLKLGTAALIKVNVPLPFNVRDESGKLLLAHGRTVGSAQLDMLLARGMYVDREEYRAAAAAAVRAAAQGHAHAQASRLTVFDHWEQSIWRLDRLLRGIDAEPAFPSRMHAFAAQLMELVDRDPDVAVFVSMRQDPRRMALYGLTHALHTALVCRLAATQLEWPQERQRTLLKAALTMNVAMLDLQGHLAVQTVPLSDEQRQEVATHPQRGCDLLRAAGVADEDWLHAVRDHHERSGGRGYPRGNADVSELAAFLRLADVFMAKISPRAARPPLRIQEAAHQMYTESQGGPIAAALIKSYGIYPPGDLVELVSGERAVVVRRGATAHAPLVVAVTDRSGTSTLNAKRRDTAQAEFRIAGPAQHRLPSLPMSVEHLYRLAS